MALPQVNRIKVRTAAESTNHETIGISDKAIASLSSPTVALPPTFLPPQALSAPFM